MFWSVNSKSPLIFPGPLRASGGGGRRNCPSLSKRCRDPVLVQHHQDPKLRFLAGATKGDSESSEASFPSEDAA